MSPVFCSVFADLALPTIPKRLKKWYCFNLLRIQSLTNQVILIWMSCCLRIVCKPTLAHAQLHMRVRISACVCEDHVKTSTFVWEYIVSLYRYANMHVRTQVNIPRHRHAHSRTIMIYNKTTSNEWFEYCWLHLPCLHVHDICTVLHTNPTNKNMYSHMYVVFIRSLAHSLCYVCAHSFHAETHHSIYIRLALHQPRHCQFHLLTCSLLVFYIIWSHYLSVDAVQSSQYHPHIRSHTAHATHTCMHPYRRTQSRHTYIMHERIRT